MVWRLIWNLFHEWDRIFSYFRSCCFARVKMWKKILSYSWNKFHINLKSTGLSVYYIFFGFWTRFDTACNTRHDVTIFHILIFSQCEYSSLWRYPSYLMDKTRFFTAENVIIHLKKLKKLKFGINKYVLKSKFKKSLDKCYTL